MQDIDLSPIEQSFFEAWRKYYPNELLLPQYEIKGGIYRLDFAHVETKTAIELDGFAAHSSTDQIAGDRKRQREIEALGWRFIRFGGKEVYQDVAKCINETYLFIQKGKAQQVAVIQQPNVASVAALPVVTWTEKKPTMQPKNVPPPESKLVQWIWGLVLLAVLAVSVWYANNRPVEKVKDNSPSLAELHPEDVPPDMIDRPGASLPDSPEQLSAAGQLTKASPVCLIKGNIDAAGNKIYHVPGQKYYEATEIEPLNGERWFCSDSDAVKNGWRKSQI